MIQALATARYMRTSAQKAGLVLDLIRGKDVNRALATLQFARKSVATDIAKVLRSAIANAQHKDGFSGDVDRLYRVGLLREPGTVGQAGAAGADGPCVPRAEADRASHRARLRAAGEGGADRRGGRRGAQPDRRAPRATKSRRRNRRRPKRASKKAEE